MSGTLASPAVAADLSTCDHEPIHIPGTIQPHGLLFALAEPGLTVSQASANAVPLLGPDVDAVLGASIEALFGEAQGRSLRRDLEQTLPQDTPVFLRPVHIDTPEGVEVFNAVAHCHDGVLVLELEAVPAPEAASFLSLYPQVQTFLTTIEAAGSVEELGRLIAAEVRRITGFGRVLIYRFDPDWNGEVIAEDRADPDLPSYLGLHFPASDVPAQARELYLRNRTRLIPDADYQPVPIVPELNPETGRPLDLSFAALRSVSPVHVEYMRNMETAASMSISVLVGGELWGLISCHHRTPLAVPFEARAVCDFIGQFLSLQIAAHVRRAEFERRIRFKAINVKLLAAMATTDPYTEGLLRHEADLLEMASAAGAALVSAGECTLLGQTPGEAQVRALADWLTDRGQEELFATDALPALYPPAGAYADRASGLLAVSISKFYRSYILWFRPEVVQTVSWGGDPRKPVQPDAGRRLHPRKSFETWKETVLGKSLPWETTEREAAVELRNAVVGIVLRKAEELAALNAELERSNKELEAFSYSVSHDLRAPFRHIVGYSELLKELVSERLTETERRFLQNILESGQYAGKLVDNLLSYSQVGRTNFVPVMVDLNQLVREVQKDLASEAAGRDITWHVGPLPTVKGDLMLLRLVFQNLLSNAVKYTRPRPHAEIQIGHKAADGENVFFVRDNGIGFASQYRDKLFGVFQRLHRMEDFEGTGIGLANVRRIVARHGGRTWAEGEVDRGATFYFTLPEHTPDGPGP